MQKNTKKTVSTTKSATLTSVVSKVLSTKKSGSSFTKESFLSSVAKKMPTANSESAMRILRYTNKVSFDRKSGKYQVR
ncbi:MAG: hypothetical protein HUJ68_02735 [Clostridia bacterium]|nr:hypothetical protein [Clostridia bacterium]